MNEDSLEVTLWGYNWGLRFRAYGISVIDGDDPWNSSEAHSRAHSEEGKDSENSEYQNLYDVHQAFEFADSKEAIGKVVLPLKICTDSSTLIDIIYCGKKGNI